MGKIGEILETETSEGYNIYYLTAFCNFYSTQWNKKKKQDIQFEEIKLSLPVDILLFT